MNNEVINEKDVFTATNKSILFKDVPIKNIYKLGKTDYFKAEKPLEEHIHKDCFEVCYHYKGKQTYMVGDKAYNVKSGDIFLTFPNELHGSGTEPEEKSGLFYLIFNCMKDTENFMGLPKKDSDFIKNTLYSCKKRVIRGCPQIKTILSEVMDLYFSDNPLKHSKIYALLIEFFYILCLKINSVEKTEEKNLADMEIVLKYIENNIYEKINISTLSDMVKLSNVQFERKFKLCTGFTPYDYIIRKKIDLSKKILKTTNLSITKISLELNFSSSQHFSYVFKKYTGMSPKEFRNT